MEFFTIIFTLFIVLPITSPFILARVAIYCLSFYLRRYSIKLSVAKCGLISFRTISISLPLRYCPEPATHQHEPDGEPPSGPRECRQRPAGQALASPLSELKSEDGDDPESSGELTIKIDNLRLTSLYWDNTCASILSICLNNITLESVPAGPGTSGDRAQVTEIKIKSFEFPIDKIRGDFVRHYSENFNIQLSDLIIPSANFVYKIEKLSVAKSVGSQRTLQVVFDRVIFTDLSVPEVQSFSEKVGVGSGSEAQDQTNSKQRSLYIEQLQATHTVGQQKTLQLALNGDCSLQCNLEFYLNLIALITSIRQLVSSLSSSRKKSSKEDDDDGEDDVAHRGGSRDANQSSIRHTSREHAQQQQQQALQVKLALAGRLRLGVCTDEDQCVRADTQTLEINASFPGAKTIQSELVNLSFDEQATFTCSRVSVSHYGSPGITCILDRKQNGCGFKLSDAANSLLNVDIGQVDLMFPYKYDFSRAFNEKLMGLVKWLKKFHKKPPVAGAGARSRRRDEGPIDFDISLRVNKLAFELEDDPFETRLRTNYMLLEDEYHEQLKRDQTLQEKINELKRTNLMLASSIVEELNRALAKKNSDIYIQRSKQLYASEARRVPLFSVAIEEADLKILADSSFHQHGDIKALIASLNPECPAPASALEFTTLFCRILSANFKSVECKLRDFSLPMLTMKDLTLKGQLLGSEQVAAARARRLCSVYVGRNSPRAQVERSMTPLKIFHNLQVRCTTATYTHGPCWEPVLQQVSLAFDDIVSASSDPSPALPWWDKMRFMFHGQARLNCNQLSVLLHASNDPYNQTELIELGLSRAHLEWLTGRIRAKGDFEVLLRTASKYDECRFLRIPNFDVTASLEWNCLGNPHEHSSITPCAPDKVPDYSSHLSHDSYRSFRSQSLSLSLNMATQFTSPTNSLSMESMPSMLFFGSTIRWLENQKFIFVGPSRLTRRGRLFNNTKPKKPSLSRIFKEIRVNMSLNRFQILYWSSVSKRHGIHMLAGELSHCSEHTMKLSSSEPGEPQHADGLLHRQQSIWQTVYMNSSLANVEVWLYNLGFEDLDEFNEFNTQANLKNRQYFVSLSRVSYNKEAPVATLGQQDLDSGCEYMDLAAGATTAGNRSCVDGNLDGSNTDMLSTKSGAMGAAAAAASDEQVPNHRLVVHDLKAAWTKDNRDVVVGIFDAFFNSQQLKKNLSTEALKAVRVEGNACGVSGQQQQLQQQQQQLLQQQSAQLHSQASITSNSPPHHTRHQRHPSTTSLILTTAGGPLAGTSSGSSSGPTAPSVGSSISKNRAVSMLQKLIADAENNPNVYSEESHSGVASETHLYGVEACQMDDVVDINCQIELVNSQVMLCGTETPGYVIVSAANTEIRQATHLPVWKNRTLLSKTTWTGSLRCMQYYATVDGPRGGAGANSSFVRSEQDIQWLEPDNIDSRSVILDYPDLVGSGHSVGGVVSSIVGKLYRASSSASDGAVAMNMGRHMPQNYLATGAAVGSAELEPDCDPVQLQRIISRCNCLFYYAGHTVGVSDDMQHLIPPLPDDDMFIEPWDKEVGVDSFTLTHQDLEISTNSQQYAMIMDIINNLMLFVEPHKKTAFERLERMRFRFELSADEDQREPISQLQDQVRKYVAYLRRLERERYLIYRASIGASIDASVDEPRMQSDMERGRASDRDRAYRKSLSSLSEEIANVKEQVNSASEELAMMISCYKEIQLGAHKQATQKLQQQQQAAAAAAAAAATQHGYGYGYGYGGGTGAFFANVIRRNEICFKSARWRVTDSDGQLGLADIVLSNFLYSKVVKSDDSVEHTIELGHLHVSNLIPNQAYKDVLRPTELQANIPLDRHRALRIYCRELAPVAGIPVKEHLEINVVPFTVELTLQFFQKMVKFFFPEREAAKEAKRAGGLDVVSLSNENQLTRFGSKKRGGNNNNNKADSGKNNQNDHLSIASGSTEGATGPSSLISSSAGSSGGGGGGLSNPSIAGAGTGGGLNLNLNNLRVPGDDTISTVSTTTMASQTTVASLNSAQRRGEEIEKMRERAAKNHTFVYVKIPGIPIKVSYKGKKQKSVTDLKNMSLTLPTYEYHNSTWTWLDLLMAVKNDSKHTVIKQALKQKMKIRPSSIWSKATGGGGSSGGGSSDQQQQGLRHQELSSEKETASSSKEKCTTPVTDEDKARLLLGAYAKKWIKSAPEATPAAAAQSDAGEPEKGTG